MVKREMIEMMNKTSDEVSVSDTEAYSNSDEQCENEQKETGDRNNEGELTDNRETKEGVASRGNGRFRRA